MRYNPEKHHRHSIRLRKHDYSSPGFYFITICSRYKENLFVDLRNGNLELNEFGKIAEETLTTIEKRFQGCYLDMYIVMPNHVHLLIEIRHRYTNTMSTVGAIHELPLHSYHVKTINNAMTELPLHLHRRKMSVPLIIGFFKMNTAKSINTLRRTPGVPVWQRNYYEHIIRSKEELFSVRDYIRDNPGKWDQDPENPILICNS